MKNARLTLTLYSSGLNQPIVQCNMALEPHRNTDFKTGAGIEKRTKNAQGILWVKQASENAHAQENRHVSGSKNSASRNSNQVQFFGHNSCIFCAIFDSSTSFELRIAVRF